VDEVKRRGFLKWVDDLYREKNRFIGVGILSIVDIVISIGFIKYLSSFM